MKSSRTRGCFIGGFTGIAIFVAPMATTNDVPDFGGVLIVPFFVLFFAGVGTFAGWLVGKPATLSPPSRSDFVVWAEGCLLALILCAAILLLLAGIGRYATSH